MKTLIGSLAAKQWFPDFREPQDVDYHSPVPVDDEDRSDIFVDPRLSAWDWGEVATPEELYTMKVSHSFWEIGNTWQKHMNDIVFFQRKGVEFNRELYDILVPIWKDLHGRKRTSLAQNAQNFFADAVERKYVHDSIHESIAYYDRPMYESILVTGEEVMTDSAKFFSMEESQQLKLVREEVMATALERVLIPKNYKHSPTAAYAWALQRTITSLFKNEWALWTVLHYDTLARPDCDYVQRHFDKSDKLILL